jgi:hypothetical protein
MISYSDTLTACAASVSDTTKSHPTAKSLLPPRNKDRAARKCEAAWLSKQWRPPGRSARSDKFDA